ncbi:patatin-like phospholipase family protein [Candidatus Nitrosocosmicus sp. R]
MDSKKNSTTQRPLVLQGGGSIGAYEAGVFNVLYHWIQKDIKDKKNENIFDVIAGTSIGAINGAILVSFVQQNNTWDGASSNLLKFWDDLAYTPDLYYYWPFWNYWALPWSESSWINTWDNQNNNDPKSATGEAARRYYSSKDFILHGAPGMFSKPQKIYDDRFLDSFGAPSNVWYVYDNKPLRESIMKSATFPIATNYYDANKQELKQPRLLSVSVDVEEGETVVFDSYSKEDGSRSTEYTQDDNSQEQQPQSKEGKIKILYDEGLMVEHIMASASVPIHYDYTYVPKTYDYDKNFSDRDRDTKLEELKQQGTVDNNYKRFWEGGISSNTPLRELIQSHQEYWSYWVKEKK